MSIFDSKNEVKSNWIQWGKVNDSIAGTLLAKRTVPNNLPNAKEKTQTVYDIKTQGGEFHRILEDKSTEKEATKIPEGEVWSVGGKAGLTAQLRNVKIGQIIGLKFVEQIASKTKGFNPTKVIKCYTAGEMDPEVMAGIGAEAQADIDFDKM